MVASGVAPAGRDLEEFWSSVRRRTTKGVQLPSHCELVAEAKVGNFDVHVCIQEEVLSLERRAGGGEDEEQEV